MRRAGQATVEYVMVISVIVIAMFAVTALIWDESGNSAFVVGSQNFQQKMQANASHGYFSDDLAAQQEER